MTNLSDNALTVLKSRYLLKDKDGNIIEDVDGMFKRVADFVASKESSPTFWSKEFYDVMRDLKFLPNSPTLMNAGTDMKQLSACFVVPIEDSMDGIFDAIKHTALITKTGGGVGFSFNKLRPKNSVVGSTNGVASGPVSFMKIFNETIEQIKQGGRRRGAMMGILCVDHPDIIEFIDSKKIDGNLSNFNISVAITDEFMTKLKNGDEKSLEIWNKIVKNAWDKGDPGLFFIDSVNSDNPTPDEPFEACNPCGETPLLPYEACVLGSVNLSNFVQSNKVIDWKELERVVRIGVRFLDNTIDVSEYPLPQITENVKKNRKIGLGVMGFADMLYKLMIPYNSCEGSYCAKEVMKFINKIGHEESINLYYEKGAFPNVENSIYKTLKRRNATVTTIAPTGTLSIIGNCSGGIEPTFALSFVKNVMGDVKLIESNPIFVEVAKQRGFYSEELMEKISKHSGSCKGLDEVPEDVQKVFVTAHDVEPEWHVKMQSTFQIFTNNAVSKTVNLPNSATVEDVDKIYRMAYEKYCKGVTIYRDGSKMNQVLTTSNTKAEKQMNDFLEAFENHSDDDIIFHNVKIPDIFPAKGYKLKSEGKKWYITVCFKDRHQTKPFAIFVNTNCKEDSVPTFNSLEKLEELAREKCIHEEFIEKTKKKYSVQSNPVKICRMLGLLLRHNIRIIDIIKKLDEVDEAVVGTFVHRIKKFLTQFVPESMIEVTKCPECGQNTLTFQEGCKLCNSCGYSACS